MTGIEFSDLNSNSSFDPLVNINAIPNIQFKKIFNNKEDNNSDYRLLDGVWVKDSSDFSQQDEDVKSSQISSDKSDNSDMDKSSSQFHIVSSGGVTLSNPFIRTGFSSHSFISFVKEAYIKLSESMDSKRYLFSFKQPPLQIEFVRQMSNLDEFFIIIHFKDARLVSLFLSKLGEFKSLLSIKFKKRVYIEEYEDDDVISNGIIKSFKVLLVS